MNETERGYYVSTDSDSNESQSNLDYKITEFFDRCDRILKYNDIRSEYLSLEKRRNPKYL